MDQTVIRSIAIGHSLPLKHDTLRSQNGPNHNSELSQQSHVKGNKTLVPKAVSRIPTIRTFKSVLKNETVASKKDGQCKRIVLNMKGRRTDASVGRS